LSQRNTTRGRYLRTQTDRVTPPITTPSAQEAKALLQDFMMSDTHLFGSAGINVARFASNRIDGHPAVTSGLKNQDYLINVPNTNPLAQGLAALAVTGLFTISDPQQPSYTSV